MHRHFAPTQGKWVRTLALTVLVAGAGCNSITGPETAPAQVELDVVPIGAAGLVIGDREGLPGWIRLRGWAGSAAPVGP